MGEIYALAVSKDVQNQGFSAKLLNEIMQKARIANFSKNFCTVQAQHSVVFKTRFCTNGN
jgi:Acetyltransferase (GNAT) family.